MLRLHPYEYHRPRELEAALELLKEHAGDVMPIAGGTDLVPNMKHRLFAPGHLVALKGLPELHGIVERQGEIVLGAAESLSSLADHHLVRSHLPSLARAAGAIAHPMIRNQATLGGNICLDTRCTYYNQTFFWREALGFCLKKDGDVCHVVRGGTRCVAAHSADTPPILMALGAKVDTASPEGVRSVELDEFFIADGIWNTQRKPDEIVTRLRVPLPSPGLRTSYQKLRERRSVDFPLLSLALAVGLDGDDRVESIALVVAALGAKPRRIGGLETLAKGERLHDELIEEIARQAYRQSNPLDNIIVDIEWRRAMVPVFVRRAIREALARP
ncbi:MAG: FAD binding domain-containing protein [Gemmatimonadota bacterium]|nr:MAG: FAD binding domain-containing protein [Gemmatimonadota bacterium]